MIYSIMVVSRFIMVCISMVCCDLMFVVGSRVSI